MVNNPIGITNVGPFAIPGKPEHVSLQRPLAARGRSLEGRVRPNGAGFQEAQRDDTTSHNVTTRRRTT